MKHGHFKDEHMLDISKQKFETNIWGQEGREWGVKEVSQ